MSAEKKILDFDNDELFVSSRILNFILNNGRQCILSEVFQNESLLFFEKYELNQCQKSNYPLQVLEELLNICRKANASNDQFIMIGNKLHELHNLIFSLLNENLSQTIDWTKELNLIKLLLVESNNNLIVEVELSRIIFIDHKKMIEPLLSLLKGFFDRIFTICFNAKPKEQKIKNGFRLSYTRLLVSDFDFVQFVRNEEFVYSRIKKYLDQPEVEAITDRIYFFLFRDIKFSIEEIASKLNLSVRSLQRSLKEEETSFRVIKENVRKELSLRYLKDENLLIQDVTMFLGYSERGAFEKAFKKWYGKNPSEYRKTLD